jgi:hypothetical protein
MCRGIASMLRKYGTKAAHQCCGGMVSSFSVSQNNNVQARRNKGLGIITNIMQILESSSLKLHWYYCQVFFILHFFLIQRRGLIFLTEV